MDIRTRRRKWAEDEAHSAHIGSSGAMGDINVTPFVDVVLVLLVIVQMYHRAAREEAYR